MFYIPYYGLHHQFELQFLCFVKTPKNVGYIFSVNRIYLNMFVTQSGKKVVFESLNTTCKLSVIIQPYLEEETGHGGKAANIKSKNNGAAVYVGSSLTVHNPLFTVHKL